MTTTGYNTETLEMESGEPTGEHVTYEFDGLSKEIELALPKLEDVGHPKVPEVNQDYIPRQIYGELDLKVLSHTIEDPDFFAMMEGEAGVGKNMSAEWLLSQANWPRERVNFSISTSYEGLVGRFVPKDSAEGEDINTILSALINAETPTERKEIINEYNIQSDSNFKWVDGLLTRCVKNGWAFIADEINAADDEAIMPFNGLTEDRDSRYLTIEELSTVIEPHPRFRLIATRNPEDYAGVGHMNSALESRAYILSYDYHEKEALYQILQNRTNIIENSSEEAMKNLVRMVQDIRKQEQAGTQFMTKISTRDLIKMGRLTDIMSIENAARTVIMGVADPTDENALENEINTTNF